MARSYAKLLVEMWDADSDFRDLSEAAQRLYIVLFSQPQLSSAGLLPLQPRRWARLANDSTERKIERALAELVEHPSRKVIVDRDTDEVLVRAHIRRDELTKSANGITSIRRAIEQIESEPLRYVAGCELARAIGEPLPPPPQGGSEGGSPSPNGDGGEQGGSLQSHNHRRKPQTKPQTPVTSSRSLTVVADDDGEALARINEAFSA